jgi:hypothetical protein
MAGSAEAALAVFEQHPEDLARVEALCALVAGFETPYSLKLLATVHFAAIPPPTVDPPVLSDRVAAWSLRKACVLKPFPRHMYGSRRLGSVSTSATRVNITE